MGVPEHATSFEAIASPKPGETGVPTPFPPGTPLSITPVPTGSDHDFDAPPKGTPYIPPTPKSEDPYHLIVNATMGKGTIEEHTLLADAIVTGTVRQVGPARWTTSDGTRPANPWAADNKHYIFTPVTIQIGNILKGLDGTQLGSDIVLQAFGGQVGQDEVEWTHDRDNIFEVRQQVVVFLTRPGVADPIERLGDKPLWKAFGRYTLTPEGNAKNWHSDIPAQQLFDEIDRAIMSANP